MNREKEFALIERTFQNGVRLMTLRPKELDDQAQELMESENLESMDEAIQLLAQRKKEHWIMLDD